MDAFIYDYGALTWLSQKHKFCQLKVRKDTIFPAQDAFAFSKTYNWTKSINNAILYHRENKDILKLQKKWFSNDCEDVFSTRKAASLGINEFGGLIIVLCLTVAACFPMLLPEHFYERYLHNMFKNLYSKFLHNKDHEKNSMCKINV